MQRAEIENALVNPLTEYTKAEKRLALWHRKMVALGYPDAHHRYVRALWRLKHPHSYTTEGLSK